MTVSGLPEVRCYSYEVEVTSDQPDLKRVAITVRWAGALRPVLLESSVVRSIVGGL